jgi:hypothetical protein
VSKNPRNEIFQLGCFWPSGPSNYPAGRLLIRTISAHSKTGKSYASQRQKKQGDSTYKFVYVKIKI